jgi:AraC family transcriptional regulator of adaptative response/methylated-DNA-[protein]-cysteine methyltransferase
MANTATGAKSRDIPDTQLDPRWARIVARERAADGLFWYSVATTGVYCRPSCPSRTANPKNVAIHDTRAAARAAGYRACKRCHPDAPSLGAELSALIARACRFIERSETMPALGQIADAVALSPGYFHRLFKAATGLTPRGYATAHRAARVRAELARSATVTAAIYDAGFNSNGRFYENSAHMLGMTPTQYRAGGVDEEIRFAVGQCSLGAILVASSAKGVVSILLGDDPQSLLRNLQDRFRRARLIGGDTAYESLVARVIGLIEAPQLGLELPLDVRGTAFQQRVWLALADIPSGQTASYADIARELGMPNAVRAVASACGANHLAVAIPCHRVVRTDGSLSGYRWGVERKRALLEREAAHRD